MAKFLYKAKKGLSQTLEGIIEAENQEQAIARLIDEGLTPVEVRPQVSVLSEKSYYPQLRLRKRPGLKELNVFTQQLKTLIRSKVELLSSLSILYKQTENEALKRIIFDLHNTVKEGQPFSNALSKYPRFFPSLYVNLIRAGEASGRLDEILSQLAEFLEKEEELNTKVRTALVYPTLMVLVGLATVFVLFSFVIPRLIGIFQDFQASLPLPTRILLWVSNVFKRTWFIMVVLLSIFIFFLKKQSQAEENTTFDWLKLHLPVIGNLTQKQAITRFSRTLALLLHSGLPIFQSLKIAIPTIENKLFMQQLEMLQKDVMAGSSLAKSMKKVSYFPPFLIQMVTVGEEGGRLEEVLVEVADSFNRETEAILKIITSLIEPLVILSLGLILGGIIMAMLLPIFQINMLIR